MGGLALGASLQQHRLSNGTCFLWQTAYCTGEAYLPESLLLVLSTHLLLPVVPCPHASMNVNIARAYVHAVFTSVHVSCLLFGIALFLVAIARLDALESDNIAMELVDVDDDEDVSLEDEEHESLVYQRRHKRETRQARALEKLASAKKTRSFLDLLHEANLEALPSHVPTYLRAAVGPPSSSARRHFCSVCGYFANYTCTICGARFCCIRCQKIHTDTRCQKFIA
ncbi:hypothetical protein GOP47_0018768 [Adiantum capillus-veneris]|uniref:HIT-type domain-containing protein n=1 Tax=Adiantum capillus-veneris TaxID=13818 RepID=A0A9D4Z937_ADICA|nr:hypothetical protein GOP47_0018768 [Adiantum capillus-veneris]